MSKKQKPSKGLLVIDASTLVTAIDRVLKRGIGYSGSDEMLKLSIHIADAVIDACSVKKRPDDDDHHPLCSIGTQAGDQIMPCDCEWLSK